MRVQTRQFARPHLVLANGAGAPQPNPEPQPPEGRSGLADKVQLGIHGVTFAGLGFLGAQAGMLGGTALGAVIGGSVGPMVSAVAADGFKDFLWTSFSTAGKFTKAGMILGGVAGVVGAYKIGKVLGEGAANLIDRPQNQRRRAEANFGPTGQFVASTMTGIGGVAGGLGGYVGGAAAGTMVALMRGTSVGSAAALGGAIGAGVFAVVGGLGGLSMGKGILSTTEKAGGLALKVGGPLLGSRYRRVENLKEEEVRQNQKTQELEDRSWDQEAAENNSAKNFERQHGRLDSDYQRLTQELAELQGGVSREGESLYAERHPQLVRDRARLDAERHQLEGSSAELAEREQALDQTLVGRSETRLLQEKAQLREELDQRQAEVEGRTRRHDSEEKSFLQQAEQKAAPKIVLEKRRLNRELRETKDKQRQQEQFLESVKKVADSTAERRAETQERLDQAREQKEYWQRLLEQVEKDASR